MLATNPDGNNPRERSDETPAPVFTVERNRHWVTVIPVGDLGRLSDKEFTCEVENLAATLLPGMSVILDLGRVDNFSSDRLLGPITMFWNRIRKHQGDLVICNICSRGQDVLKRMKLDRLWPIYATRQEALKAVAPSPRASSFDP